MVTIRAIRCSAVSAALVGCTQASTISESAGLPPENPGTVSVSGRVTSSDGKPLAGAGISIPGVDQTTRTDADRNYSISNVAAGPSTVVVSRNGYATARTAAKFSTKPSDSGRNHVDVTLFTADETADLIARGVADSAILWKVGFLSRQASVRDAYFITPEAIAAIQPRTIADIFRHVPVMLENPGPSGVQARGGCSITYVNGIVRNRAYRKNIETYVPLNKIVAAEVYPPGQYPPPPFTRASTQSSCATVGIWTRG
jgi:hypothetical protein